MRRSLASVAALLSLGGIAFADAMWASHTAPVAGQEVCSLNTLGGQLGPCGIVVVTASGAITVTNAQYAVIVNKTTGAATTVTLPTSPGTGEVVWIKDGKGDAATNNITITPAAGNIDGSTTDVINANYGAAFLIYNGTQWNVLAESSGSL